MKRIILLHLFSYSIFGWLSTKLLPEYTIQIVLLFSIVGGISILICKNIEIIINE